jgi:hypothetical protein
MDNNEEAKTKKAGRPTKPKTKSPPIKDALADSKLTVKDTDKNKKDKKDKPPTPDNKLKDSLKELTKVATANKKEINNINKKIDNIIKKIKD